MTLMVSAMQFVARDRGEALIRKWLSGMEMPAATAEILLAAGADLLLSYPAARRATAFDLASEQAAMMAQRRTRFHLLQVETEAAEARVGARCRPAPTS